MGSRYHEYYVATAHVFLDGSESVEVGKHRWFRRAGETCWRCWLVRLHGLIALRGQRVNLLQRKDPWPDVFLPRPLPGRRGHRVLASPRSPSSESSFSTSYASSYESSYDSRSPSPYRHPRPSSSSDGDYFSSRSPSPYRHPPPTPSSDGYSFASRSPSPSSSEWSLDSGWVCSLLYILFFLLIHSQNAVR